MQIFPNTMKSHNAPYIKAIHNKHPIAGPKGTGIW